MKGVRATGRILALNSLENRVHEVEFENGVTVVSKFYRPGRWNEAQLTEEHQFLQKLKAAEIPVVAPLELSESAKPQIFRRCKQTTLAQTAEGIFFVVFPKVRGRLLDEFDRVHLETLGRYLGRIHQVGKVFPVKHRLKLNVKTWGEEPLALLLKEADFDPNTRAYYEQTSRRFLQKASEILPRLKASAVHGDCHLGNTLWQNESPFFLDFDDMMVAPPVQDIWMIIRGRDEESLRQREILLQSYETMCEFDWSSLSSIEILRGLRIIHYSAWILRRRDDPAFAQAFPTFASAAYWRSEIEALDEINQLTQAL